MAQNLQINNSIIYMLYILYNLNLGIIIFLNKYKINHNIKKINKDFIFLQIQK